MVDLKSLTTDLYEIVHLTETDLEKCLLFETKPNGRGLQNYLRNYAYGDELSGIARTYLIKDVLSGDIVAFFTLRTGLITVSRGIFKGFDTHTGIEMANFAVNEHYRHANEVIPKLGSYIFGQFVMPIVRQISQYVGAEFLYIYALPNNKLMDHYSTMGFSKTSIKMERFVYRHVKPSYDRGCRFMYQKIN